MGIFGKLFGTLKKSYSWDIILQCRKCGARYILGKNALVASMRQVVARVLGSGGMFIGNHESSPDLIKHGTVNQEFRTEHDAQLKFLWKARLKGLKLSWCCFSCQEVQEYPWCIEHTDDHQAISKKKRESRNLFAARSKFASNLTCPHCNGKHGTTIWPERDDAIPFSFQYYNDEDYPLGFFIVVQCLHCHMHWRVVWDRNPGPVKGETTALHVATEEGNLTRVEDLLRNGAFVDPKDDDFATPLYRAVLKNHADVVEMLIAHGADVNTRSRRLQTPLFLCAGLGYTNLTGLLIKSGANVNAKDEDGATSLHAAAWNGQKAMVVLLLASGAKPTYDFGGMTPVRKASQNGHSEIAKLLEKSSS